MKRVKRKFFADFVSVLHDLNVPKIISMKTWIKMNGLQTIPT